MTLTTEQLTAFKIARYEFCLRSRGEAVLPPFLGSTLRGSFGHALKAVACSMPHGDCSRCFLVERCLYPKLFETSAKKTPGLLGKGDDAPRPFIFIPPQPSSESGFLRARDDLLRWRVKVEGGQQLVFGLTLFGDACVDLPYVVYTINLMAQHGFGADRASFALEAVAAIDANGNRELVYTPEMPRILSYGQFETTLGAAVQTRLAELVDTSESTAVGFRVAAAVAGRQHTRSAEGDSLSVSRPSFNSVRDRKSGIGGTLTLRFLTPTRMRIKGELLENPSFAQLVRSLSLRLSMLAQTHAGAPLDYDYRSMIEHAETVLTRASGLRLMSLDRHTNRQGRKLGMDGFMGEISFAGPAIAELLPLIVAGEFLNLGSATAFGLGRYRIAT